MKKYYWLIIFLLVATCWPVAQASAASRLIKSADSSAVYYEGADGLRHVFPNQQIFKSWYQDFSGVVVIAPEELISKNLGGVVCYQPNTRLIKIVSDPKVYWVDVNCVLRHVSDENAAVNFFGADWVKKVDDLPVEYFDGYTIGTALDSAANLPTVASNLTIDSNQHINENTNNTNNTTNNTDTNNTSTEVIVDGGEQPTTIKLTAIYNTTSGTVTLSWLTTGGNTNYGFNIIKATNDNPLVTDGEAEKLNNATAISYNWENLSSGDYYFRICRINSDGSCGTYSNTRSLALGATSKTASIILTGDNSVSGTAKLSWQIEWLNPKDGFYVVRNTEPDPRRPTHLNIWVDKTHDSYDWSGLSAGTYHFRVCRHDILTDICTNYSNDVAVNVQ